MPASWKEKLHTVIDAFTDAVTVEDAAGECVYANEAAARLFGTTESLVGGRADAARARHRVATRDGGALSAADAPAVHARRGGVGEAVAVSRDRGADHDRWSAVRAFPLREGDTVTHVVSVYRDISERVAAERELAWLREEAQRAVRARDDLLAVASHDLKNLLGAILLHSSVIQAAPPSAPADIGRVRKQIDAIGRAAERMEHLLRDLLDLASIDAGKLRLDPRRQDAVTIVREAVELQGPLAASKKVELAAVLPAELPLHADRERLLQVLLNLIGNSVKYTPPGGHVVVVGDLQGDRVRIRVRDDGPGIGDAEMPHLFDRWFQGQSGDRRGKGLGLFIARSIVEAHGGEIGVETKAGVGSTFFFLLPASRSPVALAVSESRDAE